MPLELALLWGMIFFFNVCDLGAHSLHWENVGAFCQSFPGLRNPLEPWSRAARKWRENEEMKRKWRENEEMERD